MKIQDICESERPREKMLARGARQLGNAELLAVLLRTGTRTGTGDSITSESAIDIAHRLLSLAGGSLLKLAYMSPKDLCSVPGIKEGKAVSVMAAMELGRRFMAESPGLDRIPLTDAGMVYDLMRPHLKGLRHEECWIILLNNARYVIGKKMMTQGGSSSTTIDVKDIVRQALDINASAMILVHNHPSGNPRPGNADMNETMSLKQAAEAMDMLLLDHVIVCDDCYFSFSDEKVSMRNP
ncbi:MAG: DNA repair protein RadC [Bacteroidales bacterium]|nr:DNA repair protein RadC [Candidatus Cryptobacteroides onthequi]